MASLYDLKVREGDLVILGTDGLFDNLFDSEIIYLASLCLSPYESKLFFRGSTLSEPVSPDNSSDTSPEPMVKPDPMSPQLSSARRLTEAWVSGGLPHPLAVEPPITTDEFGIATPPSVGTTDHCCSDVSQTSFALLSLAIFLLSFLIRPLLEA